MSWIREEGERFYAVRADVLAEPDADIRAVVEATAHRIIDSHPRAVEGHGFSWKADDAGTTLTVGAVLEITLWDDTEAEEVRSELVRLADGRVPGLHRIELLDGLSDH